MGQFPSIPFQNDFSTTGTQAGIPAQIQSELDQLAERLRSALAVSGIAIAIQSHENPLNMVCVARRGENTPALGALLDINSGISGQAARENRTLYSDDTRMDPRVNKDACERLRIRSLVAAPIGRDSRCIGMLEVFSSNPHVFNGEALAQIHAEAVKAGAIIDRLPAEVTLPHPENWTQQSPVFRLDPDGRLSAVQFRQHPANSSFGLFSASRISEGSSAKQKLRWIALASVAASLAFSGPRLLHRGNAASNISAKSAVQNAPSTKFSITDSESTGALVSDATPSVRALMAKALSGDNTAQASLADHYVSGEGVTRDAVKGAVWAVIARNNSRGKSTGTALTNLQPYEIGQVEFNLGTMFRDGIGTPRNLVNAYSWFSLSNTTGDVRASAALLNLEQVMSADQIAEARRRAPELLHTFRE